MIESGRVMRIWSLLGILAWRLLGGIQKIQLYFNSKLGFHQHFKGNQILNFVCMTNVARAEIA